MRFFITDDDDAVRSMLTEIIEDYDLGEVAGEAENGSEVDSQLLMLKKIDILIIDLLMPVRDGIETIREIGPSFDGKIIMLSQVEDKDIIGKAYSLGIEYYITKPINRFEVISVIQKVMEHMRLHKSIRDIQRTLSVLGSGDIRDKKEFDFTGKSIVTSGQYLLAELGMIGESGCRDLLDMLDFINQYEKENPFGYEALPLKDIFINIASKKLGPLSNQDDLRKEVKASEQRARRAIYQALNHLASLGLTDYSNPKFEEYASKFFDFSEVRKLMLKLEEGVRPSMSNTHINMKKFVKVLYIEARKML